MVPHPASQPAGTPFNPQEGNAHEQEAHQVGNDKGTPAILNHLNGKAKEVPEANRIPGHGQNKSYAGAPVLIGCTHARVLGAQISQLRELAAI